MVTIKQINNQDIWEKFLNKHLEANFLQSWYWGEFHKSLENQIERIGFYKDNKLVAVMLSVAENAKRGKYLTIPGGPIIDWQDREVVSSAFSEMKKIAKNLNCVFVRVRPQLVSNDFSKNLFRENGFRDAPMHLHAELTSQLDITKSEEGLLMKMRKSTRYEIKKAINMGIKITAVSDPDSIKDFYDLQIETSKRQGFVPFSYDYLYQQFKVFAKNNYVLLYKAEFEKKLLVQAFVIFYGKEAVYHYGASTTEGRNYPGAYLIQWQAILEAKKRGMERYNFWGVSPENKLDHRFAGLSLFKRGFGGIDVEYLHAQDLIVNSPKYLVNFTIETLRKKMRNV